MISIVDHVGYQFPYAIKINPKITLWRQSFVETMAAHKQPDSPAQNSKYSINVDNCTIDKLEMGDYNTVNGNRSGRSWPSSQESSPILDSGESPFTKGKRVNTTFNNLSWNNDEDTVSGKRDHRSQQSKNGPHPIWSKLQVVRKMFLVICIGVRQWQFRRLHHALSPRTVY